jgi:uncharacterized protein (UPF0335 family)
MTKVNGAVALDDTLEDMTPVVDCIKGVEDNLDRLASMKGEYMEACKEVRADIADLYAQARGRGANVRAIRAVIKARILSAQIADAVSLMERDTMLAYYAYGEAMSAWVTTPLGQVAERQAEDEVAT